MSALKAARDGAIMADRYFAAKMAYFFAAVRSHAINPKFSQVCSIHAESCEKLSFSPRPGDSVIFPVRNRD
jgi:hypothetical protein